MTTITTAATTVQAGHVKFVTVEADKVGTALSMGLRLKGKEKLGLTEKQQVIVSGELDKPSDILSKFQPEQVQAILAELFARKQLAILKDSLEECSAVPEQEFPIAGFVDTDTVIAALWADYNPAATKTRASSGLSAEQVEVLYGEELFDILEEAMKAKNPSVSKTQLSKAHAFYMQLITKLFAKSAVNWLNPEYSAIFEKMLGFLQDQVAIPDSFTKRICDRIVAVIEAQEAKAKKLAEEQAALSDML